MKAAPCSWWVGTKRIVESRSEIRTSAFSSPGTPKMYSTPSASRHRRNRSLAFMDALSWKFGTRRPFWQAAHVGPADGLPPGRKVSFPVVTGRAGDTAAMQIRRAVPDLTTDDPAAAAAFYTEVLGFQVAMDLGWAITCVAPGSPQVQLTLLRRDASAPVDPNLSVEVDV